MLQCTPKYNYDMLINERRKKKEGRLGPRHTQGECCVCEDRGRKWDDAAQAKPGEAWGRFPHTPKKDPILPP
jgi:hypothetical protein